MLLGSPRGWGLTAPQHPEWPLGAPLGSPETAALALFLHIVFVFASVLCPAVSVEHN